MRAALVIGLAIGTVAAWGAKPDMPAWANRPTAVGVPAGPRLPPAFPVTVVATAYCSCAICTGRWAEFGLTASGAVPTPGKTIAADWRVLPNRACVWVQGFGRMVVEDTGSAIRGNRIDIFMASHEAALEFGRKVLKVEACQ